MQTDELVKPKSFVRLLQLCLACRKLLGSLITRRSQSTHKLLRLVLDSVSRLKKQHRNQIPCKER